MSRIGFRSVRVMVMLGLLLLFASAPVSGFGTMGGCSLQTAVTCPT